MYFVFFFRSSLNVENDNIKRKPERISDEHHCSSDIEYKKLRGNSMIIIMVLSIYNMVIWFLRIHVSSTPIQSMCFYKWHKMSFITALSPKFRTLQWNCDVCPTVAITSRCVEFSKNGWVIVASHNDIVVLSLGSSSNV